MTEPLLHDLDVEAGRECVGRRAVAEAVQADRREFRVEGQPPEPVAHRAGMQWRPVLASEHQPRPGPYVTPREPFRGLAGQVRAQRCDRAPVEGNVTPAGL
ncbi:MAG: hypothetical protein WBH47_15630 [Streptosporangiaceae bacterium]